MATPQWIERMYPGRTGRDHLGLTAVHSGEILTSLSPQVNVLTVHPRYHSFYAFVLDEYWQRDIPRSRQSFIDFYRPAEFIYSVAANLCDGPDHGDMFGVVGSTATGSHAVLDGDEFDVAYDYIKSRMGGFGLYYASPMEEMGITVRGGRGLQLPVDAVEEWLSREKMVIQNDQ